MGLGYALYEENERSEEINTQLYEDVISQNEDLDGKDDKFHFVHVEFQGITNHTRGDFQSTFGYISSKLNQGTQTWTYLQSDGQYGVEIILRKHVEGKGVRS